MRKISKFYIHIQSDTLAHYLVRGIFCPSRFLSNKNKDIQDQFDSYLLLSDKQWNIDCDCSIEIDLIEEDIARLIKLQDNYFALADCLPISRLRMIHFEDRQKAENVIWNINQGAAYVPAWAISYEDKVKKQTVAFTVNHSLTESNFEPKIKIKMERYDRLMGGLAFMKIGLLNARYEKLDVTSNYLTALAFFNTQISSDLKKEKVALNSDIQNIFSGKNRIYKYLAKSISFEEVLSVAKKENQKVAKQFNAIKFELIDTKSLTYKLAILHTYGKGKVKSDNDFVSGLLFKTKSEILEELALVFGLHTGYNTLRNSYSNSLNKVSVKFKLETKIEFYLIESLFNYAFQEQKISSKFEFLETISQNKQVLRSAKSDITIKLLGDFYSYKKQDVTFLEKDSLSSTLLRTIKNWYQKNNTQINEELLLSKFSKIIIPEIQTSIINKKSDLKVNQHELPSSVHKKADTENKPFWKIGSSSSEIKSKINNSKDDLNVEPSLFTEFNGDTIKKTIENFDDLTIDQLEKYSVKELKEICKKKGYKGYSKFKRSDLIKFILSQ